MLQNNYPNIPIQLCQFHQNMIIRRYTTNNPRTDCGKDLKRLIAILSNNSTEEEKFILCFKCIKEKYKDFLKEKSDINPKQFKHKRLRSAIRSLNTNLSYLFTYKKEEYKDLKIPNTTNSCEGKFGRVKTKLKIHSGLREKRKNKLFEKLIKK